MRGEGRLRVNDLRFIDDLRRDGVKFTFIARYIYMCSDSVLYESIYCFGPLEKVKKAKLTRDDVLFCEVGNG